jgi:MarR-like DNA-binding transcriptional regulator SgrR of sgrS sRNA
MPSARLQQQFIRLWQCCEGKSQETTLNELAALLSCSRRQHHAGSRLADVGSGSRAR